MFSSLLLILFYLLNFNLNRKILLFLYLVFVSNCETPETIFTESLKYELTFALGLLFYN